TRNDLLAHSPTTTLHIAEGSLSIKALCEAAVEESDNTAANTLLKFLCGPQACFNRPRLKSAMISRAALWPGAPVTPPPGWVPEPHMYKPFSGPR
ncbi:MAG: hypothetical protein QOD56_1338, partial [Gammaproteobacteria bacterium]|nr:hypothetical protein [Gammaproteobacteria bacterium]